MNPKVSISPASGQVQSTIATIINTDPIISQYFHNYQGCSIPQETILRELVLDGIRYRALNSINQQSKKPQPVKDYCLTNTVPSGIKQEKNNGWIKDKSGQKHYNVAYIKHQRFLSPKQKKQSLTPKVTEIVPVNSRPQVIYGKPKVNIDEFYGCPYHEQECDDYRAAEPILIKQIHLKQFQQQQRQERERIKNQWEQETKFYNSDSQKQFHPNYSTSLKAKNNPESNFKSPQRTMKSPKRRDFIQSSNNEYSDSDYLSTKNLKSPKSKRELHHTSSRIKQFIDRDKKNKALQKKLQDQQSRLDQMERTMNGLKEKDRKIDIVLTSKEELGSENQFDTLMKPELVSMFMQKKSMKKTPDAPQVQIRKTYKSELELSDSFN